MSKPSLNPALALLAASFAAVAAALGLQWWKTAQHAASLGIELAALTKPEPFRLATAAYPRANEGKLNEGMFQRHQAQTAAAEKSAQSGGGGLVLVGDSITHAWENHAALLGGLPPVVNLGTSGDRTENVLWRLRNGNLPKGLDPKAFALMIGTNNTGHRMDKPEDIAAGVVAILDEIQGRFPRTPVILYRIFPRGAQADDKLRLNNAAASDLIAKAVAGRANVQLRDLAPKFLQPDGTLPKQLMPDLLHLSREGYEIWAADLREALR